MKGHIKSVCENNYADFTGFLLGGAEQSSNNSQVVNQATSAGHNTCTAALCGRPPAQSVRRRHSLPSQVAYGTMAWM